MREKLRFNAYKALMYVAFAVMSLVSTSAMAGVSYPALSTGSHVLTMSKSDDNFDGYYWNYTFTTTAAGKYTFESSGDYDLLIMAYDSNGNYIDENDDIDEDTNRNFHLELDIAANTTYEILIFSCDDDDECSFTMSVDAPCNHSNTTYVAAKDATCTKTGSIAYYICNDCNFKFSDAACTEVVTDIQKIGPHGSLTYVAANAATCTKAGNVAYYICSDCSRMYEDKACTNELADVTVAKLPHDYDDKDICKVCGNSKIPALSTGSHVLTMSKSDDNYINGYWYYTFTTTRAGKYTFESSGDYDLEITVFDQDGNEIGYNDGIDTGNKNYNFHLELALAANTKYQIRICSYNNLDKYSFTMSVDAPCNHSNTTYVAANAATCTKTGNVAYYICNDCSMMYSDEACTNELADATVAKSPHDYDDKDICKVCGNSKIPALSTGSHVLTMSTEDDNYIDGYWYYTFTTTAVGEYTFESSGDYDLYISVSDRDDEQIGDNDDIDEETNRNFCLGLALAANTTYKIRIHSYDDDDEYSFTMSVDAPCNHSNTTYVAAKDAASCKEPGNIGYYLCNDCNCKFSDAACTKVITDIQKIGPHGSLTYVAAKASTCAKTGNVAYYICSDCSRMYKDKACTKELADATVARLSHDFDDKGICKVCGVEYKYDAANYLCFTADGGDVDLYLESVFTADNYWIGQNGNGYVNFYSTTNESDLSLSTSFDKITWESSDFSAIAALEDYSPYKNEDGAWEIELNGNTGQIEFSKSMHFAKIPAGSTLYVRNNGNISKLTQINNLEGRDSYWKITSSMDDDASLVVNGDAMSILSKDLKPESVDDKAFYNFFSSLDFDEDMSNITFSSEKATVESYDNVFDDNSTVRVYFPEALADDLKASVNVNVYNVCNLDMTDETVIFSETGIKEYAFEYCSNVNYTRDIKAHWNTICLPFNTVSDGNTKFYTISSLEDGVITLSLTAVLPAGTPAICYSSNKSQLNIKAYGEAFNVTHYCESDCLVGTYESTTVPGSSSEYCYFGLSANTGKYVRITSDVDIKPYRAYIQCSNDDDYAAGLRQVILGEDNEETLADAINELTDALSDSDTQVYDMNGRKTNGLQKGLNIIKKDGKVRKVMVE